MITAQNNLVGKISAKQNIIGKLNNAVIKEYPELEDLTVTPSAEEQHFKSEKYGYDNVIVKVVESEELNIIPSTETQIKEGLYNKVTVEGDNNLVSENIKEGTEIFGVQGNYKGEVSEYNTILNTIGVKGNPTYSGILGNIEEINSDISVNGTSLSLFFKYCKKLKKAPYIDTSNVTHMDYTFSNCTNLEQIPIYNTEKVTNMSHTFEYCTKLQTIPLLDTQNVTIMNGMFYSAKELLTIPSINMNKVTNTSDMFNGCTKLTEIPPINTENVTNISGMFSGSGLITAKGLNTSKARYIYNLFASCKNLEEIDSLECDNVNDVLNITYNCSKLVNLGGFINLGKRYTQKTKNYSSYKLDLSYSPLLTHESLMNVINGLYDLNLTYNVAGGGTLYTQQLTLGSTNIAKLTAEEIAIATNKRLDSFLERREYEIFFLYKTKNDSSR